MATLLIFTKSYPFSLASENNFLKQEIGVLVNEFDKVIIIPEFLNGDEAEINEKAFSNYEFGVYRKSVSALFFGFIGLFSRKLICEVGRMLSKSINPIIFLSIIKYYFLAQVTKNWVIKFYRSYCKKYPNERVIFYTWWFDYITLGLVLSKYNNLKITRAHGYDLYENRNNGGFIPFRKECIDGVNIVYADSKKGAEYLKNKYPQFSFKIKTSLLGVPPPKKVCELKLESPKIFVSCSFLIPLKRVSKIIEALALFGKSNPNIEISYWHFGDGPLYNELVKLATDILPPNVQYSFPGYSGLDSVYQFYEENYIQAFINVSETEGTPVSIMEAISHGLPVIATSVGGNTEIVNGSNGLLLKRDFEVQELANAMKKISLNENCRSNLSEGSLKMWSEYYSASKNYVNFSKEILENNDINT